MAQSKTPEYIGKVPFENLAVIQETETVNLWRQAPGVVGRDI